MSKDNTDKIKEMFDQISSRYVLMNTLMTFGMDRGWRKFLIQRADIKNGVRLLDVATGTGDVIFEALNQGIRLKSSAGIDFSSGMLEVARSRIQDAKTAWFQGDALTLPFKDNCFDAVTSAYLMRNAVDIDTALSEQFRVLRPGGRMACLDTTPPSRNMLSPFIDFYFLKVIPLLGALIASSKAAYTYLPETTKNFKPADELRQMMLRAGFKDVAYKKFMFGTIAVHWGVKPGE